MTSEILTCADCGDPFCTACDDEFRHCPDCEGALCGECAELSLDLRMARCLTCGSEDDLTRVRYPYHGDGDWRRRLYKAYTAPSQERGEMPESIFDEAKRVIQDRRAAYDEREQNFTRIATLSGRWCLGITVTPEQVAMCMIGMKLAREVYKPGRDNRVDMCGYADCLEELVNAKEAAGSADVQDIAGQGIEVGLQR
jgi:hypothetical protein